MDNQQAEHNQIIHEFIKMHPRATLASHGPEETINLANVFTYIDSNFFLYCVTRPDHRKHTNIHNDPNVSLLFTDDDSIKQAECIGKAYVVDEATSIANILPDIQNVLIEHKSQYWIPPVAQIEGSGYLVLKIVPDSITYRSYSRGVTAADFEELTAVLEGSM